jgi:hypothetical protein
MPEFVYAEMTWKKEYLPYVVELDPRPNMHGVLTIQARCNDAAVEDEKCPPSVAEKCTVQQSRKQRVALLYDTSNCHQIPV